MNINIKRLVLAFVASALLFSAPSFASNEDDPNILILPVGAIASGAAAVGTGTCDVIIPRGIKIVAAYVNTTSGITSNATDSIDIRLQDDGVEIAALDSATASQTAYTPKAMTVATDKVAAGSVLSIGHVQSASGMNQALANVNVILHYRNSDSD